MTTFRPVALLAAIGFLLGATLPTWTEEGTLPAILNMVADPDRAEAVLRQDPSPQGRLGLAIFLRLVRPADRTALPEIRRLLASLRAEGLAGGSSQQWRDVPAIYDDAPESLVPYIVATPTTDRLVLPCALLQRAPVLIDALYDSRPGLAPIADCGMEALPSLDAYVLHARSAAQWRFTHRPDFDPAQASRCVNPEPRWWQDMEAAGAKRRARAAVIPRTLLADGSPVPITDLPRNDTDGPGISLADQFRVAREDLAEHYRTRFGFASGEALLLAHQAVWAEQKAMDDSCGERH